MPQTFFEQFIKLRRSKNKRATLPSNFKCNFDKLCSITNYNYL